MPVQMMLSHAPWVLETTSRSILAMLQVCLLLLEHGCGRSASSWRNLIGSEPLGLSSEKWRYLLAPSNRSISMTYQLVTHWISVTYKLVIDLPIFVFVWVRSIRSHNHHSGHDIARRCAADVEARSMEEFSLGRICGWVSSPKMATSLKLGASMCQLYRMFTRGVNVPA